MQAFDLSFCTTNCRSIHVLNGAISKDQQSERPGTSSSPPPSDQHEQPVDPFAGVEPFWDCYLRA